MKLFFALMLVLSFVSAGYAYIGCVGYYAHNHYGQRSALLKTTEPPLGAHLNDALTPAELANTDEHLAIAYRASVSDGERLGAVSDIFRLQSIGVSGLLFLSSIFGLRLSTKKYVHGATNHSPEPTAVGAVSSAVAVRAASRRGSAFFVRRQRAS